MKGLPCFILELGVSVHTSFKRIEVLGGKQYLIDFLIEHLTRGSGLLRAK